MRMLILYKETRKVFIIQERERGIIVINIVPKENPPKKHPSKETQCEQWKWRT